MSREYHVTLTVDADDDRQARFKAAMLERCGNEVGIGPARVLGVQHVEVVYRDVGACEVCGSLVCQGPAMHAQDVVGPDAFGHPPGCECPAHRRLRAGAEQLRGAVKAIRADDAEAPGPDAVDGEHEAHEPARAVPDGSVGLNLIPDGE